MHGRHGRHRLHTRLSTLLAAAAVSVVAVGVAPVAYAEPNPAPSATRAASTTPPGHDPDAPADPSDRLCGYFDTDTDALGKPYPGCQPVVGSADGQPVARSNREPATVADADRLRDQPSIDRLGDQHSVVIRSERNPERQLIGDSDDGPQARHRH